MTLRIEKLEKRLRTRSGLAQAGLALNLRLEKRWPLVQAERP